MRSLQRRVTLLASQLWVTYRRGPLARGTRSRWGRRPRPGDRVPDLACTHPDGSHTRLHAELGRSWALLVPAGGGDDHLTEARKHLGDIVVTLTLDHPGQRRDVWLVRPDAHLAWRGGRTEAPHLGQWLHDVLKRGTAKP